MLELTHLEVLPVVQLGEQRPRAGDRPRHEVREPQPHPGGERARVGASEGDPGGQVVVDVVAYLGDEATRVLQTLSRTEVLHVLPGHVLGGLALAVEPVLQHEEGSSVLLGPLVPGSIVKPLRIGLSLAPDVEEGKTLAIVDIKVFPESLGPGPNRSKVLTDERQSYEFTWCWWRQNGPGPGRSTGRATAPLSEAGRDPATASDFP